MRTYIEGVMFLVWFAFVMCVLFPCMIWLFLAMTRLLGIA